MTVNFVDLMVIDRDTIGSCCSFSGPWANVGDRGRASAALIVLIWWFDPLRVRRRVRCAGCAAVLRRPRRAWRSRCRATLGRSSTARTIVSKFARSGVDRDRATLITRGVLESDADGRPSSSAAAAATTCAPAQQAAAHHHGVRRVELRHPRDARASRCRPDYGAALHVVRRQAARLDRRRRRAARAGSPNTTC